MEKYFTENGELPKFTRNFTRVPVDFFFHSSLFLHRNYPPDGQSFMYRQIFDIRAIHVEKTFDISAFPDVSAREGTTPGNLHQFLMNAMRRSRTAVRCAVEGRGS
ncbi:MAG: hypothetical protein U5N86_13480 [Planctomycetota bacterium]|nr:hypothetical protein [Planctomycetota bacterium]